MARTVQANESLVNMRCSSIFRSVVCSSTAIGAMAVLAMERGMIKSAETRVAIP